MTYADAGFLIGSTHTVCQDYAIAGTKNGTSYAVVSDGCSGSPNSDIGARILATNVARWINNPTSYYGKPAGLYHHAHEASWFVGQLDLPTSCLDATLLIAVEEEHQFRVCAWGDGVIAARRRQTGLLQVTRVEFPSGYPAYPSYALSRDPLAAFQRHSGKGCWDIEVEDLEISEGGGSLCASRHTSSVLARRKTIPSVDRIFPYEDFDMVAVLSDGASSFVQQIQTETSIVNEPVPLASILQRALGFKSAAPGFVQRRLLRFRVECQKLHQLHMDDFSVAALLRETP